MMINIDDNENSIYVISKDALSEKDNDTNNNDNNNNNNRIIIITSTITIVP